MIEVVLSNKRGMNLSGTVWYSEVADYQDFFCNVELLKPTAALKILRNLDGVNYFNNSDRVWIFSDEVEPEHDRFPLQPNGFGKYACEFEI